MVYAKPKLTVLQQDPFGWVGGWVGRKGGLEGWGEKAFYDRAGVIKNYKEKRGIFSSFLSGKNWGQFKCRKRNNLQGFKKILWKGRRGKGGSWEKKHFSGCCCCSSFVLLLHHPPTPTQKKSLNVHTHSPPQWTILFRKDMGGNFYGKARWGEVCVWPFLLHFFSQLPPPFPPNCGTNKRHPDEKKDMNNWSLLLPPPVGWGGVEWKLLPCPTHPSYLLPSNFGVISQQQIPSPPPMVLSHMVPSFDPTRWLVLYFTFFPSLKRARHTTVIYVGGLKKKNKKKTLPRNSSQNRHTWECVLVAQLGQMSGWVPRMQTADAKLKILTETAFSSSNLKFFWRRNQKKIPILSVLSPAVLVR